MLVLANGMLTVGVPAATTAAVEVRTASVVDTIPDGAAPEGSPKGGAARGEPVAVREPIAGEVVPKNGGDADEANGK